MKYLPPIGLEVLRESTPRAVSGVGGGLRGVIGIGMPSAGGSRCLGVPPLSCWRPTVSVVCPTCIIACRASPGLHSPVFLAVLKVNCMYRGLIKAGLSPGKRYEHYEHCYSCSNTPPKSTFG